MAKYNTRFIKKVSQLNSDIQSYRCKDFSLKQVSGLMGGGGGGADLPDPPTGSATALVPLLSFLQHSVIRTQQLLATDACSELETQLL